MLRGYVLTTQPSTPLPIDWSNPITRSLHHAINFVTPTRAYVSTRNGVRPADGVHTYTNAIRPRGRAGVFATGTSTAAAGISSASVDAVPAVNTFSVLYVSRTTGAGGAGAGRVWGCGSLFQNTSGANQGTNLNGGLWSSAFAQNVDHVAALTANTTATAVSSLNWCLDGVFASITNSAGPTGPIALSADFVWGNNLISAGARVYQGEIVMGVLATRVWTSVEMASLVANPWQVFLPPRRLLR